MELTLPFQLRVSHFRLSFSGCGRQDFRDWTFEAFGGEEWQQLYECDRSPWPGTFLLKRFVQPVTIPVDAFASNRFRIRLLDSVPQNRCMHLRCFELFGTILPPWRLDD